MDKTKAESVLGLVSCGLVDAEEHGCSKLAGDLVALAVVEDVRSYGIAHVRDLVERAGGGDLSQDGGREGPYPQTRRGSS